MEYPHPTALLISVVNKRVLPFRKEGNTRRTGYECPSHPRDGRRQIFESRNDAPEIVTNTRKVGRCQASTIKFSRIPGSRVPVNTIMTV